MEYSQYEFETWAQVRAETAFKPDNERLHGFAGQMLMTLVEAREHHGNINNNTDLLVSIHGQEETN